MRRDPAEVAVEAGAEERAGSALSLFDGGAGAAVISSWHHGEPFSFALRCQTLPGTGAAGGRTASVSGAGQSRAARQPEQGHGWRAEGRVTQARVMWPPLGDR